MANDPQNLSIGALYAVHVPEPDETYDPAAHDSPEHTTGFVDIGVTVNGVYVTLLRRKASGLFSDIARAKAAHDKAAAAAPATPAEPVATATPGLAATANPAATPPVAPSQ
jgi:hypothetical protein